MSSMAAGRRRDALRHHAGWRASSGTGYLPDVVRFIAMARSAPRCCSACWLVLVGVAFKLAAVRSTLVSGRLRRAPAEVGAFLSALSKGAALALLARLTLGMAGMTGGAVDRSPGSTPLPISCRCWDSSRC